MDKVSRGESAEGGGRDVEGPLDPVGDSVGDSVVGVRPADLRHLEWAGVVEALTARLCSPAARECAARLFSLELEKPRVVRESDDDAHDVSWGSPRRQSPIEDPTRSSLLEHALASQSELDDLEGLTRAAGRLELAQRLREVVAIEGAIARARRGLDLGVGELADISTSLNVASSLRRALDDVAEAQAPEASLAALRRRLGPLPHADDPVWSLARRLAVSIDRDGPNSAPLLADGASPTLGSLRARVRSLRAELQTAATRMLRRPGMAEAFGDRYVTERDGRVVLPVRASAFSRAGAPGTIGGIIHDASASGQTLFVEPHALVDDNNALRSATVAVRAEEARVLAELSMAVGASAGSISAAQASLLEVDGVAARLALSQALGGIAPELVPADEGAVIELPGARHPLMALRGREVVPNDLRVAIGTALVVSGPNAGGKTVALKTVGLCVLLAQLGVRLPTRAVARVPVVSSLVSDVGDDQSLARDLSTFSAHVGHVVHACAAARRDRSGCLVLLDEVAVGTDPDQGAALAEAIVVELVAGGATLVVTTHYERLKLLAVADPERFVNAAVGFDLEHLRSTFRIHLGVPGNSSALMVARRLGVPDSVLARAEAGLDDTRGRVDALIADVVGLRDRLAERTDEVERVRLELAARERRLAELERSEVERASTKLARAHAAVAAELRGLQTELRAARKAARSGDTSGSEALEARARKAVAEGRPPDPAPEGEAPRSLQVGGRVRIERLGVVGEVVAIKGDRVTVQLASGRTTATMAELREVAEKPRAKPAIVRTPSGDDEHAGEHFGGDARPVRAAVDNVVDLRGARADEATLLLESMLARALAVGQDVVLLRHGHGSGALRKVIREHLMRLPYVVRHRPGMPEEGGDAVTVVWVRP